MPAKSGGLGRGLGALIRDTQAPRSEMNDIPAELNQRPGPTRVKLSAIRPGPWQPRRSFDEASLEELAQSIREHGVLQPLLLRRTGPETFELIAGERRFRAAQLAGASDVPAIILDATDQSALEIALIENLQRSDLTLLEEAEGYRALAEKFNLTQDQIAARVGRARSTVANALRLLDLPVFVRQLIAERKLSPGHAKALLGLEQPRDQEALAQKCVEGDWSVRQLERAVNRLKRGVRRARSRSSDIPESHLQYVTDQLHQKLGTAVRLTPCRTFANGRKAKGTIEIDFYSPDDLDRILVVLGIAGEL
ncbi:MAG: ParB/RepB/Spo0J family partition protein [Kiritimatiellae bacterium]|nr:ParB/RepB/Spo0J family partition protein [Kiritimatiellia bacterium]MDW8458735.1 ParB/RepB/Spo0J family partition protein [Verrucomicrobiota bacterium]